MSLIVPSVRGNLVYRVSLDLDGDRGCCCCDIEVEDEMEAMEHIELFREPIDGEGVVGGVA